MSDSDLKNDEYWRKSLTPEQFRVCREKGTERAFTGEYWNCKDKGLYHCRCCGEALFESDTKFDSGSGWPSFYKPVADGAVTEVKDSSHGMIRIEAVCEKCDCHLGHVFPDGPQPTGMRYCINSESVRLESTAASE